MFIETSSGILNTDQIKIFLHGTLFFVGESTPLDLTEEDYKKLINALLPRPRKVKDNEPKNELNVLFDQLHQLTGGKGKAVFTLGREKKLNELLTKHRMTPELLIRAATNIGKDAFLQGANDSSKRYGDVDYLLRPDKAAKWSEEQTKKGMFH